MQRGPFKRKTDRSATRQLALTIALVFAVFCFGPAAIAQQSIAPAGSARLRIKNSAVAGGVRKSNPSTNSPAKAVTVGLRDYRLVDVCIGQPHRAGDHDRVGLWIFDHVDDLRRKTRSTLYREAQAAGGSVSVAGARLGEASSMLSSDRSVMRFFVAATIERSGFRRASITR